MIQQSGHRRVERLTVPRQFRGLGLGTETAQLLDLSPAGARIEHVKPLHNWTSYFIDLPDALGGNRVKVEVVWSQVSGHKPVDEGKRWISYQSGLAFIQSTPEEQAAIKVALVRIAGEWALSMLRELRRLGGTDPTHRERLDALCGETLAWLRQEIDTFQFGDSR